MVAPENSSFMVLFVQGAWHSEAHAAPLIASIKAAGYHCETTPYPSNILTAANPYTEPDHPDYSTPRQQDNILPDAHTDAAAIRKKLNTLIEDEGKTVLMFAHSYGGRAASEAADQTLSRAERMRNGKKGGLLGIFYACSVPLPVGMSMITFSEGTTFPGFMAHAKIAYMIVWPSGVTTLQDPEIWLFHELPPDQQQHWKSLLVPQSSLSSVTKLNYPGYVHAPCGYLLCDNDRLVPIAMQERLVKGMKDAGAEVKTWRCPLGHEPALAWTEGLRDLLLQFGRECV